MLLSTHIVSDIEKCADRVMVIKDGQKVFDGTEEETGKDLETFYLDFFGGEDRWGRCCCLRPRCWRG